MYVFNKHYYDWMTKFAVKDDFKDEQQEALALKKNLRKEELKKRAKERNEKKQPESEESESEKSESEESESEESESEESESEESGSDKDDNELGLERSGPYPFLPAHKVLSTRARTNYRLQQQLKTVVPKQKQPNGASSLFSYLILSYLTNLRTFDVRLLLFYSCSETTYSGVTRRDGNRQTKWQARVNDPRCTNRKNLGTFTTQLEAAVVREDYIYDHQLLDYHYTGKKKAPV